MLKAYFKKQGKEVGCDEAGRGCLAGPVVAAAVILDPRQVISQLNDSKKMSENARHLVRKELEKKALAWAVGIVSEKEIDDINILNASFLAMHRALDQIKLTFDRILVDGNCFTPYQNLEHHCIIKGDSLYQSIAAASVFAKTERDAIMQKLDLEHPEYQWKSNKGYPTKKHRQAIETFGSCAYHRQSFRLLKD
ncbi:MAG: ribonuclease HII [Flavobacteriales bacterium]